MGESTLFKDQVSPAVVRAIAQRIRAVHPAFPDRAFCARVERALPPLELKDRIRCIADALWEALALPFPEAARVLVASAGADDGRSPITGNGWMAYWPLNAVIGARGLDHPEAALDALEVLTTRASAEFDVRPYLARHPALALARVRRWAASPDWRVRRLASEGTRPRLPWGARLEAFVRDPSPMLPILEALRDDPEEAVRRSVANHLNDVAKDHPDRVVALLKAWLKGATPHRERLVRHALRTLVKQGHPGALALLGAKANGSLVASAITLSAGTVAVGEDLAFTASIRNDGSRPATVVADYVLHHLRANGATARKVYKLAKRTIAAGEELTLEKRHAFRLVTTRTWHPGEHAIALVVNGVPGPAATFRLALPRGTSGRRERGAPRGTPSTGRPAKSNPE